VMDIKRKSINVTPLNKKLFKIFPGLNRQ